MLTSGSGLPQLPRRICDSAGTPNSVKADVTDRSVRMVRSFRRANAAHISGRYLSISPQPLRTIIWRPNLGKIGARFCRVAKRRVRVRVDFRRGKLCDRRDEYPAADFPKPREPARVI